MKRKQHTQDKTDATDLANTYGCDNYREEMILLALRQKLQQAKLSVEERDNLLEEITRLEKAIGF